MSIHDHFCIWNSWMFSYYYHQLNCIYVCCKFNAKKMTKMENRERVTSTGNGQIKNGNKTGQQLISNLELSVTSFALLCFVPICHFSVPVIVTRCPFPVFIASKPNERIATGKLLHWDDVCQNEKLIWEIETCSLEWSLTAVPQDAFY